MSKAATTHNSDRVRTAYAYEVDEDGGGEVKTTLRVPIPHDRAATGNAYRILPWHSIAGESSTAPWSA